MKKTPKKKTPTIDEISEIAADGKDVSKPQPPVFI